MSAGNCRGQKMLADLQELGGQEAVSCPVWIPGLELGSSTLIAEASLQANHVLRF